MTTIFLKFSTTARLKFSTTTWIGEIVEFRSKLSAMLTLTIHVSTFFDVFLHELQSNVLNASGEITWIGNVEVVDQGLDLDIRVDSS